MLGKKFQRTICPRNERCVYHAKKFQRKSTNKIWMNDPSKAWKQKQLHMSNIETDKLPKLSLVNQSRCGGKFPPQKIQDSMGFSDDPMKAPTVDAINIFSLKKAGCKLQNILQKWKICMHIQHINIYQQDFVHQQSP